MYCIGVSSVGDVCMAPDTVNSQAPGTRKKPNADTSAVDTNSQNLRSLSGMIIKARSTLTKSPVSTDAPVPRPTIYSNVTREASSVHSGGCVMKVRANT